MSYLGIGLFIAFFLAQLYDSSKIDPNARSERQRYWTKGFK